MAAVFNEELSDALPGAIRNDRSRIARLLA
jgi:hypothetical protein